MSNISSFLKLNYSFKKELISPDMVLLAMSGLWPNDLKYEPR
jgi:hypothetical protein